MNIKLFQDSRDLSFSQRFGAVSFFPLEFLPKDNLSDKIQDIGNVQCSAYTICDIARDKDGVEYDIDQLFARYPSDGSGANPRIALKEALRGGLLPLGGNATKKVFSSYFEAHTGDSTPFNNLRSALMLTGYPVAIWSNWYDKWRYETILTLGSERVSGHMYNAEGWTQIQGKPYLIIEAWLGRKLYMSEEVFNEIIGKWGCGSCVLSTTEIDGKRIKTLQEKIIDALKNLVLAYQALIQNKKKVP